MVPVIEYLLLAPCIVTFGAASLSILVEAVVVRRLRFPVQLVLSTTAIITALAFTVRNWTSADARTIAALGALAIDGPAMAVWVLLLLSALAVLVLLVERASNNGLSAFTSQASAPPGSTEENVAETTRAEHTEIFSLFLFSLSGMLLLSAASTLLSAFVGCEVMSLPLYLLVGLARRNRTLSQEAALKYFLLGATASAVFLYGIALLFGAAGSFDYADIAATISKMRSDNLLMYAGLGLSTAGLLFKLGAFPFHAWVPDIYTGAPTAITTFLATCAKIAAVFALLRLLFVPLGALRWTWQTPLALIALLTIAFGAIGALTPRNMKRVLAYSAIMNVGFMLLPIVAASTVQTGTLVSDFVSVSALLFHLTVYALMTLGVFALTLWVGGASGSNSNFDAWRGLARRNPLLAAMMGIFMLSFIGIPGTGGFASKLLLLTLVWRSGFAWLALGALAFSFVVAGCYLRIIRLMFLEPPADLTCATQPSKGVSVLVSICAVLLLCCGLFPSQVADIFSNMIGLLR
jgi:NADH-quinone oxidoreductase subunit N